ALRPATAAAAQRASPKLTTRLSRGEKRNRKRIAEVGAVYEIKPQPRTAQEVLASSAEKTMPAPKAKRKWLIASVVEDALDLPRFGRHVTGSTTNSSIADVSATG
ncbi:MAG: hypothetical protein ACRDSS_14125, partial [Actinocrinis sp.]